MGAINLTTANKSGNLGVAYGGTGAASFTAGSLLTGNGTSAVAEVAPGAAGTVLSSDGSALTFSAPTNAIVTLADFYTETANVGTAETDLCEYVIPANTLTQVGDKISTFHSIYIDDAENAANLRVRFNGETTPIDFGVSVSDSNFIQVELQLVRTGSDTVKLSAKQVRLENELWEIEYNEADFEDELVLKITAQGTDDDYIVAKHGYMQLSKAAGENVAVSNGLAYNGDNTFTANNTFNNGVILTELGSDPTTPASGTIQVYGKNGSAWVIDDEGGTVELGAGGGSGGDVYLAGGEDGGAVQNFTGANTFTISGNEAIRIEDGGSNTYFSANTVGQVNIGYNSAGGFVKIDGASSAIYDCTGVQQIGFGACSTGIDLTQGANFPSSSAPVQTPASGYVHLHSDGDVMKYTDDTNTTFTLATLEGSNAFTSSNTFSSVCSGGSAFTVTDFNNIERLNINENGVYINGSLFSGGGTSPWTYLTESNEFTLFTDGAGCGGCTNFFAGCGAATNVTGNNNVVIGPMALAVGNGAENIAIGNQAIYSICGNDNIGIGRSAGSGNTAGCNNVYVAAASGGDESGVIRIGTSSAHEHMYLVANTNVHINHLELTGDLIAGCNNSGAIHTHGTLAVHSGLVMDGGTYIANNGGYILGSDRILVNGSSTTMLDWSGTYLVAPELYVTSGLCAGSICSDAGIEAATGITVGGNPVIYRGESVAHTAQAANISASAFSNTSNTGLYRISYALEATATDATAGAVTLTIAYTDGAGSASMPSAALVLTTAGRTQGTVIANRASGDITYAVTSATGVYGNATYALSATIERL